MSTAADNFNSSAFAQFLNTMNGRLFRIIAGILFIVIGYIYRDYTLGVVSMIWGLLPLSAGLFDICFVSAVLGGPLSGAKIRGTRKAA